MSEKPWLKSYPDHVTWDMTFDAKPLYDLLDNTVAQIPDNICLDFMGKLWTYGDVADMVGRAAKGLQALGVKKGVQVGLFMPNCPQFVVSYFAVLKAGGTVVNFSPLYSVSELLQQVEDSETDIMVTLDLKALYPNIKKVFDESRLSKLVVGTMTEILPFPKNILFKLLKGSTVATVVRDAGYLSFQDLLDNDGIFTPYEINPDEDVAVLQYTGGTTGVPKGAMLTHANIYNNVIQLKAWSKDLEFGKEVTCGFLPFFHVFSMTVVMDFAIHIGAKMVMMPKFELDGAIKIMQAASPTLFAGVPTMFRAILSHKGAAGIDLGKIKMMMSGGAPLPAELKKDFHAQTGVMISEGYGLTESSPVVSSNPYVGEGRSGSIGLPIPGTEIVITERGDPTKIVSQGETGEICVVGPQVMKGYWKRPDATAETIIDGRLRTGDIGYIDADGYTFIIDRDKDMILVGGFNVFPRIVEEALYKHPAVHEVTVIGIPDDYLGETPKAFVTLKNLDENISEAELKAFLKGEIGKHEQPSQIEFRAELPKTMIGKLSKKELVAEEKEKYENRTVQSR